MSEEGTEAPPVIAADGTFGEGWQSSLSEGLRENVSLKMFTTLDGLAKSYVSTKEMVGKDTIAMPTENYSDTEWDAWHTASGRPETPEDYKITRPEEISEEHWSKEFAGEAQSLFHKLGLRENQGKGLIEFWNGKSISGRKNQEAETELMMADLKTSLRNEWGNAYDQKVHIGDLAMEQGVNGDDVFKEQLRQDLGNNINFIKFAANIGSLLNEHSVISTTELPTPSDFEAQIAELSAHPSYIDGSHPQHKITVAKINRLYEERNKSQGKGIYKE